MVNWLRRHNLLLSLASLAVIAQGQLTYWAHPSCTAYQWLPEVFADFQRMAQNVVWRNGLGANDPVFARAYLMLTKTNQYDPTIHFRSPYDGSPWTAFQYVHWIASGLAGLQQIDDQATSNLRIYCDQDPYLGNDARWQVVPDLPEAYQPNSQRIPGVNQEFFDKENFVRRSPISLGCQNSGANSGGGGGDNANYPKLMEIANDPIRPNDFDSDNYAGWAVPDNLNPVRSVLSICDTTLDQNIIQTIAALLENQDLDGISLSQVPWGTVISVMVAHEISHMLPFKTNDYPVQGLGAYGWDVVQTYNIPSALTSAELYAFLMIFAELESRGYQLDADDARAREGYVVRGRV